MANGFSQRMGGMEEGRKTEGEGEKEREGTRERMRRRTLKGFYNLILEALSILCRILYKQYYVSPARTLHGGYGVYANTG